MDKIRGYKGFLKDTNGKLYCKNHVYEFNKEYTESISVICMRGFHFCKTPEDTLLYGNWDEIHEVEAWGNIDYTIRHSNKACSDNIKVIKTCNITLFKDRELSAVNKVPLAIKFIKDPSEEVQLEAVRQNGRVIQLIKNPSKEVQLEAVKHDGYAIQYIENPSEELQLEAVRQHCSSIEVIKDPSEKVQLEAVRENGYNIYYIKNPSEEVLLEAMRRNIPIKNPDEKSMETLKKLWNIK